MLSTVSLIALAVIFAALVVAWTRRFLASGVLVAANVIVYVMTDFGPEVIARVGGELVRESVVRLELSLWAGNLYNGEPIAALQLLTSMFVHADFMHLLGNLIVLLAFALPFEERVGHRTFLGLYLAAGLVGALAQVAVEWGNPMLLMGASGAVFGVIGAFAAMYPRQVIVVPVPIVIMVLMRLKVLTAAIILATMQFAFLFISAQSNVAYMAHLGGLAGGLVLANVVMKVRGKPDTPRSAAPKVSLDALAPFASDAATAKALDHMRGSQDEPEVFQAWWERFWKGARDPQTGQRVRPIGPGRVMREDGTVVDLQTEPLRS